MKVSNFWPKRWNEKDFERCIIGVLEHACKIADAIGRDRKCVLVLDRAKTKKKNYSIKLIKIFIRIASSYYFERLQKAYVFPKSFIMKVLWAVVKVMIDKRSLKKVTF
jgi:hypothetical protein